MISKAAYQVTSHYFFIEYADCVPRAVDELVRGTISQLADPGSTLHSNKTCNLNDTCGERLLPVYEICRGVKVRFVKAQYTGGAADCPLFPKRNVYCRNWFSVEMINIKLSNWFMNCAMFVILHFCRTPIFAEDILGGDTAEGEDLKPPERSFWAKYVSTKEQSIFMIFSTKFI